MIFKDKEVIEMLKSIDKKLDTLIAIHRSNRIVSASKSVKTTNKGDK